MIKFVFTPRDLECNEVTEVTGDNLATAAAALLTELENLYGISAYHPIAIFECLHRVVVLHEDGEPAKVEEYDFSMPEDAFTLELVEVN